MADWADVSRMGRPLSWLSRRAMRSASLSSSSARRRRILPRSAPDMRDQGPSSKAARAAATALLGGPAASFGQASSTTTYSGQAYVVQATVPPLAPIRISDTGPLPSTGGAEETSLLDVPPVSLGSAGGLNGADVAHAAAIAQGNASRSEASVADLSVTLVGNTITAEFLMSNAAATCSGSSPSVSGNSDLANLTVNNQSIPVSGATNQTVLLPLGAGKIVINEQSSSVSGQSGSMDVNALHVVANDPTTPGATLA